MTVNGTTYTDLKDGMLRVQLTQKDFTTKQIEITVTDGAGTVSYTHLDVYKRQMRQHLHMDIKHGNVIWQMIMEAMKWK